MRFSNEVVKGAYLYLKTYAYYENLNLFLKERIAKFECGSFNENLELIFKVLNSAEPMQTLEFKQWVSKINYHLLPKTVDHPEDKKQKENNAEKDGLFLTNVRSSNKYRIEKINYFISAPVELHIVEMLWCLFVAPILEAELTNDCYGNRMHGFAKKFRFGEYKPGSTSLFKRYVEQYNLWRDQAISTAIELSEKKENIALLSIDLKSYFYHINLDFGEIEKLIEGAVSAETSEYNFAILLTRLLKVIFEAYNKKIRRPLQLTHVTCKDKLGLPIGFASSSIIANWYLAKFDHDISDVVRPVYYGRYVDDIIMVFKRPKLDADKRIDGFIEHYLAQLLEREGGGFDYFVKVKNNQLPIQKNKLILQYFDKDHSRAGLEIFKQELEERSSAFKFLSSDHIDKELDKFAYDILYDGSANKLRSVVGLAENETELAKYLSSHIIAHRLCRLDKKDVVLPQLRLFFKGANALRFGRLWEKVYQYALIIKRYGFIKFFFEYLIEEVNKIEAVRLGSTKKSSTLTKTLKRDLVLYNRLALSLVVALLDIKVNLGEMVGVGGSVFNSMEKGALAAIVKNHDLYNLALCFRKSNLFRHHLVAWPLANYSDFEGDLTDELSFVSISTSCKLSDEKLLLSPRFIHYDEWQVFHLPVSLSSGNNLDRWQEESIKSYKNISFGEGFPVEYFKTNSQYANAVKSVLIVGEKIEVSKLRVAIANICIQEDDISAAIRGDKGSNVGFKRQEDLYNILNSAVREKADILVMPEVSVPVSWLPFMIAHARRHQLGIIFGLEHWVVNGVVFNLIVEALPFKASSKYKSCAMTARLKNHYAPAELNLIEAFRLKPANLLVKPQNYYHKVQWNGLSFATYNCFELSDIEHRVLFRSEIDLLFACVWNKDTNYYQHILESAVRDIHCYVVHSNTSQYGGSCVLMPTKTESKTVLYVKGGNNACLLTVDVDVAALRDFQYKSKPGEKDLFKHLPPGFDCEKVLER